MTDSFERITPIKIRNLQTDKLVEITALFDTGADISCIPTQTVKELGLSPVSVSKVVTVAGQHQVNNYMVEFQIGNKKFTVNAFEAHIDIALIGWDIIRTGEVLPNLTESVFKQTLSFLDAIPELKKKTVLILGQDTTEIQRMHTIRDSLERLGYKGIIVKEISDVEIQSIEEKVNMLASLSRFIICDNSFPSGHIDELKICAQNRFTTAVIQEKDKGATWMQSDYSVDYKFFETFTYRDINDINKTVDKVVEWAERTLERRKDYFNQHYQWRKN